MRLAILLCAGVWAAPCWADDVEEYVKHCQRERVECLRYFEQILPAAKQQEASGIFQPGYGSSAYLQQRIDELADPAKPYYSYSFVGESEGGGPRIGLLAKRGLGVRRVIDDSTFLGELYWSTSEDPLVVWVQGVATKGMADGIGFDPDKPLRITATKSITDGEAMRTVFVLEPCDVPPELFAKHAELGKPKPAAAQPAPPQPRALKPKPKAKPPAVRVWTDASGRYTVRASFRGLVNGRVRLRTEDGRDLAVPLERISVADREWIDGKTP